jgi:FtsZ-binding cell division protein ZapB
MGKMNNLAALLRDGIGDADNIPDCEKTMEAAADDLELLDSAIEELRAKVECLTAERDRLTKLNAALLKHDEQLRQHRMRMNPPDEKWLIDLKSSFLAARSAVLLETTVWQPQLERIVNQMVAMIEALEARIRKLEEWK